jgi:hypothetical protein
MCTPSRVHAARSSHRGRHVLAISVTLVSSVVTVNKRVKSVKCVRRMACCPLQPVAYGGQPDDRQKNLSAGDGRSDGGRRGCRAGAPLDGRNDGVGSDLRIVIPFLSMSSPVRLEAEPEMGGLVCQGFWPLALEVKTIAQVGLAGAGLLAGERVHPGLQPPDMT